MIKYFKEVLSTLKYIADQSHMQTQILQQNKDLLISLNKDSKRLSSVITSGPRGRTSFYIIDADKNSY